MSGEVKVEPRIGFMFGVYDACWVGMSGGFSARLAGEGGAWIGKNPKWNAKLSFYCGYEFGADAKLEVFSIKIAEMPHRTIKEDEWLIWEKVWVALKSVTANGSNAANTTYLTLAFDKSIPGLGPSDIALSGVSGVTKGVISSQGLNYILPISGFTSGGTLSVAVTKSGYAIIGSPKTVAIYYNKPPTAVAFSSVTQNGSAAQTTTQLALNFSQAISGLSASDIALSGVQGVAKGALIGTGSSYILPISGFTSGGTLSVAVAKSGYNISNSTRTVAVYYNKPPTAIAVTGVSLNKTSTTLAVGATETLTPTVAPANATDKTVTWSSSSASIATVSPNGAVTGVKAGSATITATTKDGGKTASCAVTVTASLGPNTGLEIPLSY